MKSTTCYFSLIISLCYLIFPTFGSCSPTDRTNGLLDLYFYSGGTPTEFIVVEKKYQRLSIFELQDTVRLVKEFTCATGQNPGTKKVSGDSRTPEGIYFITEIYEDKRITVFGSRAFHLDYPNIFDTHAGHLGGGIFIHGTNKKLIPNSTNGCITLDNQDLDELAPHLSINAIPIIVVDALPEPLPGKDLRLEADSQRFKEILNDLSFDLKKVPVHEIHTLSFLKQENQAVASIKYSTYDSEHIQYREQVRTYLTQSLTGGWRSVYAVQSQEKLPLLLALRPAKNDLVTKITPSLQPVQPLRPVHSVPQPPQPPPPAPEPPQLTKGQELLHFVEKWRSAWVAKDIETYINCYSPSFKNGDLDRDGWKNKKTYLNKKYSYIDVSIKDIVVKWTTSGADVSFSQTYKSDQYQTTGTKVLQLTNRDNRWMIESEFM